MSLKDPSMETQVSYTRQAVILRKNIAEWDRMIVNSGRAGVEDWPKSLGRLNAALNQTCNMDAAIADVMEHFVYLPRQATANPQDVPFFLSTRLEDDGQQQQQQQSATVDTSNGGTENKKNTTKKESASSLSSFALDPGINAVEHLMHYENQAADLAAEYERQMVRF